MANGWSITWPRALAAFALAVQSQPGGVLRPKVIARPDLNDRRAWRFCRSSLSPIAERKLLQKSASKFFEVPLRIFYPARFIHANAIVFKAGQKSQVVIEGN
jgi:hypothetical protein